MNRRHARHLLLGAAMCAAVPFIVFARENPQVFTSRAELVVLHVNVFDKRRNAVPGLPQSAFTVLDDNTAQEIDFFSSGDVPVTVGLVIDNSTSMITERDVVVSGVSAFADSSHPDDEMFAIVFNEHVRAGLPDAIGFTTNRLQLRASLQRFPAGGKTALYDAIIAGLDHLDKGRYQKRVLVVLSDGGDNASRHTEQEMLDRVAGSSVLVYTVLDPDIAAPGESKPAVLRRIARVSGGASYFPKSSRELVRAFEEIAGNTRRGYSIGYRPSRERDRSNREHSVKVLVQVAGRSDLSVRVRNGYTESETPGTP